MRVAVSVLGAVAWVCWVGAVRADPALDRETLCQRLKHHEGLVHSMECEYEYTVLATRPELIPMIRQVHGKEAERYLVTRENGRVRSLFHKLWRKGAKQRIEFTPLASESSGEMRRLRAFDGQIVRTVSYGKASIAASVATAKKALWDQMPTGNPMGFLYLYYERPFSEVIAEASSYSSTRTMRGTGHFCQVSIACSGSLKTHVLDITFDDRYLQTERMLKIDFGDGRLRPNHKLLFSQYKAHPTEAGETLWFPDRVEEIAYGGWTPQGEPLEVHRREFQIRNIRFNTDIPDHLFELEIPKNAKVNDDVTGLGWLPPGERPAALFPAEARVRRWWWTAGVLLTAVVVVAFGVVYVRRRRRSLLLKG